MLERLANSIDSGDLEIINMHQEGDGAQKLELFNYFELQGMYICDL